jgi:hypothetical protein
VQLAHLLAERSGGAARFLHKQPTEFLPRQSILSHKPDNAMVFLL